MSWAGYNYSSTRPARSHHTGIDLKSSSGDQNVYACASGSVAATGYNSSNGNYVVLKHLLNNKNVYSFYAHLNSVAVTTGTNISAGTKLGIIGSSGSASGGVHLHFSIIDTLDTKGGYYGYASHFTGNKVTYGGTTFYNPSYVITNKILPS